MPPAEPPEGLQAETVESLLALTWRLLDDERDRDSSFNTRAVGIAGFAGIIGTLAGSVSRDLLGAQLVAPWRAIAAVIFVIAMVALGLTVVAVIVGVLRPRESLSLGASEIQRYPTWEFVGADKAMVEGRALLGLTQALLRQRQRNNVKAQWLRWAYRMLLAALLAIIALGLTLGLRHAEVIPQRHLPASSAICSLSKPGADTVVARDRPSRPVPRIPRGRERKRHP